MSSLLVGAVLDRAPSARYFESLRFAELAPRRPLPRASVFGRWRQNAPEGAKLALLAPPETWRSDRGAFRDDPRSSESARWLTSSADALAADLIVLATGADVSPGPRDRERLEVWIDHLIARGKRRVVWQPGGLWDREDADALAKKMGAIPGFDPFEEQDAEALQAFEGEIAYGRVRAIGTRARLGDGILREIVERMLEAGAATTYLALDAEAAVKKARRAAGMIEGDDEEAPERVPVRRASQAALGSGDGELDEDDEDDDLEDEDDSGGDEDDDLDEDGDSDEDDDESLDEDE